MTVSKKIIDANDQPQGGRGIVGVNGAKALDEPDVLNSKHTIDPSPPSSDDQPIAEINSSLYERYDDINYY